MQRISFAPVLSATRSRDSCWITSLLPCLRNVHVGPPVFRSAPTDGRTAAGSRSEFLRPGPSGPWKTRAPDRGRPTTVPAASSAFLLGLLQDLDQPPPLGSRRRPGLHDLHAVTDAGDVLLVVHLELVRPADDLAVAGVRHTALHLDDDGLLHLVADHEALTDLAVATPGQARSAGGSAVVGGHRLGLAHATPSFGATERPSSRSRMIV